MAAYTTSVDPHTDYFGAKASSRIRYFNEAVSGRYRRGAPGKGDYTTIRELVAGGPAQSSGKLAVGNRIVGVGQGKEGPIEVIGMRLDEVVQMISDKGSVVRLDILPVDAGPDGKHHVISLVRDKISLDKQAAQKKILSVKDGDASRRLGSHSAGVLRRH